MRRFPIFVLQGVAFWFLFVPAAVLLWLADELWQACDWLEEDDDDDDDEEG